MNLGADVVMVDVLDDFTIDPDLLAAAITPRTKAIIPVDMGGLPAHYDRIMAVAEAARASFAPSTERQARLGRPLVVTDAAHSIGATYRGVQNGNQADATVFSLHSVKNVTTGEGGAICLNLPAPFDNDAELEFLRHLALNGQTKSAFEKNQTGAWRYDIIDQGLKVNLPDLGAAVGLAQMRKYSSELLPDRQRIFRRYLDGFGAQPWAILPIMGDAERESSCHLFLLRIAGADEARRDAIIDHISQAGVGRQRALHPDADAHPVPRARLPDGRTTRSRSGSTRTRSPCRCTTGSPTTRSMRSSASSARAVEATA